MVILGGMGNVWGVLLGAAFLVYLNQEGMANMGAWLNENVFPCGPEGPEGKVFANGCVDVPLIQFPIYGAIIVIVMLLRPQGLLPEQRRKLEFEEGVHDEPIQDASA
jgi:branched-chain amino acid transport system permease protein